MSLLLSLSLVLGTAPAVRAGDTPAALAPRDAFEAAALQPAGASGAGAAEYARFRETFLETGAEGLVVKTAGLSELLGVAAARRPGLVEDYQQLQATLLQHGVSYRDGSFRKPGGAAFTDAEWAAFVAQNVPRLSAASGDEFRRSQQELGDIQALARDGKFDEAVARFDQLLYGMSRRGDLSAESFGSVPLETTLALMQQTRLALPEAHRSRLDARWNTVDRQLLDVASRKIAVPSVSAGAGQERPGTPSLAAQAQISFYAALAEFPLVSSWAQNEFFKASTAQTLRGAPGVSDFVYQNRDLAGAARAGFLVTYEDGSRRFEAADGSSQAVSRDGRTVVEQNPATGLYRRVENGRETVRWERDPRTGGISGVFQQMRFQAAPDEVLLFSQDGKKLFVAKGFAEDGSPRVDRWIGENERGSELPDGLGRVSTYADGQTTLQQVSLNPDLLPRILSGEAPDLVQALRGRREFDPAVWPLYERFLRDLPQFGRMYETALGSGSGQIASFGLVNGRLQIALKDRDDGVVAYVERGQGAPYLKAFRILHGGGMAFMWKFSPDYSSCEYFWPDPTVDFRQRAAFVPRQRFANRGGRWSVVHTYPLESRERTWFDDLKDVGAGLLHGVGQGVEVVFSPLQTALYGILGSIHLAAGAVQSLFDASSDFAAFEKVTGFYTLKQAAWNRWRDSGDPQEVLSTYGQAMNLVNDRTRPSIEAFLDGEIRALRTKNAGEMAALRVDDGPADPRQRELDRAYMAAGVFGYANLAAQYFAAGRAAWERGERGAGVLNYAAGAFVIGGEAFVEGFGFGLAAAPLRLTAVGARTGLTAEQVAQAAQKAQAIRRGATGLELTQTEARAARVLQTLQRAELGVMLSPAAGQGVADTIGLVSAWRDGDAEEMGRRFDGVVASASGFLGMGFGLVQARLNSYAARLTSSRVPTQPVVVEPTRAEPVRTETTAVETVRVEPVVAEPVKVEPVKAEPIRVEPVVEQPLRVEPVVAEPVRVEPAATPKPPVAKANASTTKGSAETATSMEWADRALTYAREAPERLATNPNGFKLVAENILTAKPPPLMVKARAATRSGNVSLMEKLYAGFNRRFVQEAEAVVRGNNLRPNDVISHGTTLKGFLGMLMSGGMESTSSYRGVSGESTNFWGAQGAGSAASYATKRGIAKGEPGVLILMRGEGLRVEHGETLNRRPTADGDFLAAIVFDGQRVIVYDRPAIQALTRSADAWRQSAKDAAYRGRLGDWDAFEAFEARLVPGRN